VPFWLSGQFASLAAVLATPGWSLPPMQGHFYNGDAAASKALPRGGGVAAGLSWRMPLILFQPNYAPETKVLGGQPALGVAFGYGRNTTEADISVSRVTPNWAAATPYRASPTCTLCTPSSVDHYVCCRKTSC